MNTTSHANQRATERIAEAGLSAAKVLRAADACGSLVRRGSAAVLLTVLPEAVGSYGLKSNGSQVWCIVRDGRAVTLMLRRDDQPASPDRLRVDMVARLQTITPQPAKRDRDLPALVK